MFRFLYDEERHHWLTVALESNRNNEPVVNVYDSTFHMQCFITHKKTDCFHCKDRVLKNCFKLYTCHMHVDSNDCGLVAIAYAMSIRCAKKHGKLVFDQNLMRCHLLNCLKTKKIEEFPVKKRTSKFRKSNI